MHQLDVLGLRPGWIYETLVSTFGPRGPHAAPVGVWADGADALSMDLYDGSHTLATILHEGEFAANFPADVSMLFAALRSPQDLAFVQAPGRHAPHVEGCTASVELSLKSATPDAQTVRVVGTVERVLCHGTPRLINRAEGLLLESLVLFTRIELLEASRVLTALTENLRVVRKVAPGSGYQTALEALRRELQPDS
jgi:uncharacterized protein